MKTHLALSLAMLSQSERAAIETARPGSVSVVWHKPAPVALDPLDEPLPPGYVPAPFEEREPLFPADAVAYADAVERFEADAAARPLMLTA